jgi:anthranilate phosphoribosyltransferase
MRELLNRVIAGGDLTTEETAELMRQMMDEELTPVQLAAF